MQTLPLLVHSEARFSCHQCGACCHREVGVDLQPGERERIETRDWTRDGGRFLRSFLAPPADDDPTERLRVADGKCVFLDPDGLCRIEKKLGWEAKPARCRVFPFRFASVPTGLTVTVSAECQGLHKSLRGDQPEHERAHVMPEAHPDLPPTALPTADGDEPLLRDQPNLRVIADLMPRMMVVGQWFVLRQGEGPRLSWDEAWAIFEDAAAAAHDASVPLVDLPLALLRTCRRTLDDAPPKTPWPFEGPPDVPFYQALDYLGDATIPAAKRYGYGLMESAFAELRRYQTWRRAALHLTEEAEAFARYLFRSFVYELRVLQLGEVLPGIGAGLYMTMAAVVAAVQIAKVERSGGKAEAEDVNRAAREASELFRIRDTIDVMLEHRLAFERLLFDAPAAYVA